MPNVGDMVSSILGMNGKQFTSMVSIIIFCVSIAFWIENRYANLKQTQESIKHTQEIITKSQTQIAQMQTNIMLIIQKMPDNVKKEIIEYHVHSGIILRDTSSSRNIPQ